MQPLQKKLYRDISLERLSSPDRLDELMQITTPRGWLILIVLGFIVIGVVVWSIIGELSTTVQSAGVLYLVEPSSDASSEYLAIFDIPLTDAQVIKPGMPVEITLTTVSVQEYGFLLGTVMSIDTNTTDEPNASITATVTVMLETADTSTRLKWTLGNGPDISLFNGTPLQGKFIIDTEHPIERIFPVLGTMPRLVANQ